MLYYLLYPLRIDYAVFNVFKYITFRTTYAVLTSILLSFFLGPYIIEKLKRFRAGNTIRDYVPYTGEEKAKTPTMGGMLILIALVVPVLLWARLDNFYVWFVTGVTTAMGVIGYLDDSLKIKAQSSEGLTAKQKFLAQLFVSLIASVAIFMYKGDVYSHLTVPFFKDFSIDLGLFYIPFATCVIVGTANSVNLTDGLDGLAIGPVIVAAATFVFLSYLAGNAKFSHYLFISYLPGVGELTIFAGTMVGAGLGFLWFNAYPAQVFMGDIGSLALGGALGSLALCTKNEILLVLIGGVFVMETLSVIIQVLSFKTRGKRVFQMAPVHHHFQIKGWAEPKIIVRFWIVAIMLALLSISTLKLR